LEKRKDNKKNKFKAILSKEKNENLIYKFVSPKPSYRKKYPIFAFNYYLCDSKECSFKNIPSTNHFCIFFNKLKSISSLTWQQIIDNKEFHAHEVSWSIKEIPKDIKKLRNNKKIENLSLFQFKGFSIKEVRVIGLFSHDCVFEIIGLDKDHSIYKE